MDHKKIIGAKINNFKKISKLVQLLAWIRCLYIVGILVKKWV